MPFTTTSPSTGGSGNANTGDITFNGVKIIGAGTASGDGYNNGTMELVPDATHGTDQYLIIDPTAPNHIHIRGGGTQDASQAQLILGGERNHVGVSDGGRNVVISTRPATVVNTYTNLNQTGNTSFIVSNTANIYVGDTAYYPGGDIVTVDSVTQDSPIAGQQTITANLNGTPALFVANAAHVFSHEEEWNNYWEFRSDGVLSGPAMGGLKVLGLLNSGDNDLGLYANDADIILQANSGAVNIAASEININSNSVPSSLNINTYLGAVINSNRTSTYSAEEKVVATLGDFGYLNISSETDPLEGKYTTLQAPENLVIQTYGPNFGEITIQSNMGVKFNNSPTGGVYLNGDANYPETHVATIGDLPTGATGTFTSQDNKTVTVTNGIITSIESLT